MLGVLGNRRHEDVSFSPGDELSRNGVSLGFGSQSEISDSTWYLGTQARVAPDDWALEIDMHGAYRFDEGRSTVTVSVDGQCLHNQCDMFWGFGDGNKFITFAHDFDGGLWVRNKQQKGMYAFPQCGGRLAVGDLTMVLANSQSTENKDFWRMRDNLGQGDRTNFEEISTEHNDNTWPVTIEVTNDMNAHQVTFRFYSDTVDVECVYDDVFAPNTDLIVTIAPDVGQNDKDDMHIHSVSVSSDCGDGGNGNGNGGGFGHVARAKSANPRGKGKQAVGKGSKFSAGNGNPQNVLGNRRHEDVSFSPGDELSRSGVSLGFGSQSEISDATWYLGTQARVAPDDWALEIDMRGSYRFDEGW